ncbi:hypothetical protein C8A05DRAFT_36985 [Staphylotrichum tortipilum]|uniref:Uncharacterized protein n=1 Tax=Staphylotrichum tortipilum TaxID=2831512 RepID=A0AAN6MG99_9PEZI|nr:hypothetical protein C8A05DRAFT_36985 [Staphylotrichum longicolle]
MSKSDCPPVYDRSAELARYYRSVLPDSQAMWSEEQDNANNHTAPALALTDDQPPASGPSTIPQGQPEGRLFEGNDDQRPILAEENRVQHPPETTPAPVAETTPEPIAELEAENIVPPIPAKHPKRLSRISQYGPVGLHFCTDLLSEQLIEQLTKALSLQDQQRAAGHKPDDSTTGVELTPQDQWESRKRLQILVLIESYEDLLKSCRKGGVLEKKMVPILEHWLDSLHAVYDKSFPGGQEEGEGEGEIEEE